MFLKPCIDKILDITMKIAKIITNKEREKKIMLYLIWKNATNLNITEMNLQNQQRWKDKNSDNLRLKEVLVIYN